MTLGQKVCKLRELRGYSQQYMGLKLGISQTAYSKLERSAAISPVRLACLARILDVEVSYLQNFDCQRVFQSTAPESATLTNHERQHYERTIHELREQIRSLMSKSGGGGAKSLSPLAGLSG